MESRGSVEQVPWTRDCAVLLPSHLFNQFVVKFIVHKNTDVEAN
jgi:hypothetical protein